MLSESSDDEGVELRWSFARGIDDIWAGLTDPQFLPQWIGQPVETDLTAGGRFVIDHGDGALSRSQLIEVQRPHLLVMTWEFPDEPVSHIRIDLTAQDDVTTTAQLVHSGLAELTADYRIGWVTHFTYLEAAVDGSPLPGEQFWNLYATLTALGQ